MKCFLLENKNVLILRTKKSNKIDLLIHKEMYINVIVKLFYKQISISNLLFKQIKLLYISSNFFEF